MDGSPLPAEERKRLIDSIPAVTIVDSCKENIQPRRTGRSVSSLTAFFDTSPSEREHKLAVERQKFEKEIDNIDEEDDPLDIYVRYVQWIHDNYPQGECPASNLVGVLHDATNRFAEDSQYKSDARYLKLWMEYTNYVNEPKDIFKFLISNDIGQQLALFYEEYSGYFERIKKMEEAEMVYETGIEREAQPIKRLQKSAVLLKARIQARQQRGMLKRGQPEHKKQTSGLTHHGRSMLGIKSSGSSRASMPVNMSSERSRPIGGSSSSVSESSNPNSPASSFSVYVETQPSNPNIFSRSNGPLHISPASHHQSENRRTIERFSGSTLPRAEAIVIQPIESFSVYQDQPSPSHNIRSLDRSESMLSISNGEESAIAKIKRTPTTDLIPLSKRQKKEFDAEVAEHEKRMKEKFKKYKDKYMHGQTAKGGFEYIATSKEVDNEMSIEEYRTIKMKLSQIVLAEADCWSKYANEKEQEKNRVVPELTTDTREAKKSVDALFDHPEAYNEEEEADLTWQNPVQHFAPKPKTKAREND